MDETRKKETFLSSYRVIDLTDEKGFLCGKVLGDLGADVIKIERPGGDLSRNIGPFYNQISDGQKSLYWFAYNSNKRGITLNIETKEGENIFKRLVAGAHFVIESFPSGYMDSLGLGYPQLQVLNPGVVMVSITPFGQSGPYKDYKGSNLVAEAMGGLMYITGNTDETPFSSGFQYAYNNAGLQAAVAAMIAHYWRQQTGHGQHIDVSIQEAVLVTMYLPHQMWYVGKSIQRRYGMKTLREEGITSRIVYACKDGYILYRLTGGGLGRRTEALRAWMEEEGAGGELKGIEWTKVDMGRVSQRQLEEWEEAIGKFFLTKTKTEIYTESIKKDLMIFPANQPKDMLKDPQLRSRGYWVNMEHPELGKNLTYPSVPFRCSEVSFNLSKAPYIGEHNSEIYGIELGLYKEELDILQKSGVI